MLGIPFQMSRLPSELASLTALQELSLGPVAVQGELPDAWGSLTQLRELFLIVHGATGTLPSAWSALASLTALHVESSLTGESTVKGWHEIEHVR